MISQLGNTLDNASDKLERCRRATNVEAEGAQDLEFPLLDVSLGDFLMADFVEDCLHQKWFNIFVLGSHKHASHSRDM